MHRCNLGVILSAVLNHIFSFSQATPTSMSLQFVLLFGMIYISVKSHIVRLSPEAVNLSKSNPKCQENNPQRKAFILYYYLQVLHSQQHQPKVSYKDMKLGLLLQLLAQDL